MPQDIYKVDDSRGDIYNWKSVVNVPGTGYQSVNTNPDLLATDIVNLSGVYQDDFLIENGGFPVHMVEDTSS